MRFLVDECTGPALARWLLGEGHEVFSVYAQARGMEDGAILAKAHVENRILVTNDKDFGEKVYRERRPHRGVVFMRLEHESTANKIAAMRSLLASYADRLPDHFVVVTETRVRFARR